MKFAPATVAPTRGGSNSDTVSIRWNFAGRGPVLEDERFQVPLVEVHRHVAPDDGFVGFQHLEVAVAFLGRDLEADVEQLPEMRVVFLAFWVVPERGAVLRRSPFGNRFLRREFLRVNVNDGGVGGAKLGAMIQRVAINLFGEREGVAAGLGQTDEFLQPVGSRRF